MRVLVCGGRDYSDTSAVWGSLDALRQRHPPETLWVIQGGATGADALALEWARMQATRIAGSVTIYADWKSLGKAAGPIRNQRLIDEGKPDIVMAFPGGKGTADMVRRAKAAGLPVVEPASR